MESEQELLVPLIILPFKVRDLESGVLSSGLTNFSCTADSLTSLYVVLPCLVLCLEYIFKYYLKNSKLLFHSYEVTIMKFELLKL